MSNLWDLSASSPNRRRAGRRDHSRVFWNAVQQRGDKVWMRQKELGIWRSWTWDADRRGGARDRRRPAEPGLRSRATRGHPVQHRGRMGAGRPGDPELRRRVQRHLPDRRRRARCSTCARTRAPRVLFVEDDEQLDKALEVRAPAAAAAQDRRVRHGGPARPGRPRRDQPGALRELGRTLQRTIRGADAARRACRPRTWRSWSTPRAPPASPRARCTATPAWSTRCAATTAARAGRERRAHVLPAAVPHRRAHGRRVLRALHRRQVLNFVENPETVPENVREIAPTVFTAVPRVWEKFYSGVMIALKEASALQQAPTPGASAWARSRRQGAGRPAGGAG
jgi:long-chain acyl-CoA synthetase